MTSLRLRDYVMKGNYVDLPDPTTLAPSPGTSVYFWAFDQRLMYLLNEDNTAWLAQNTVPEAPIDSQMYLRKDGDWELYVPYTDEMARDAVGAALVGGTGLTKTIDDAGDTITFDIDTTAEAERIRDVMGAALVAGLGLTSTVNDAGDTITLAIDTTAEAERIRDIMGAAMVAGSNISITVNDAGDTITIAATGGGGSALTVKDEGSTLSSEVTSIDFTGAGVVATNTGGAVSVSIPGGGGGITSNLLAYAFAENLTTAGSILSPTDIPGMSVTFTLTTATDVRIDYDIYATRAGSGAVRCSVVIDGTAHSGGGGNDNLYALTQGENNIFHGCSTYIVNLAAGTHTIKIQAADALTAVNTSFGRRVLSVYAMNIIAGSPAFRGCLVKKSADQTADFSAGVAIPWDVEDYDTDTIHDNVTNNTRFTVPSGVSKVELSANLFVVGAGSSDVLALFRKNGSTSYTGSTLIRVHADSAGEAVLNLKSPVLTVTPGDYFEVVLQIPSDTSSTIYGSTLPYTWAAMQVIA